MAGAHRPAIVVAKLPRPPSLSVRFPVMLSDVRSEALLTCVRVAGVLPVVQPA